MEQKVLNTIEALKKNNISARYFESTEEAVNFILGEIDVKETIGIGGSMTVKELGLDDKLAERGNTVYFHWRESTQEQMDKARENALKADVYLTSSNAITENGQLVNIDGNGNRVAAMIFGPKRVYVIAGINKIASNLDTAMERIKANTYKNARRLKLNTPCAITGKCNECSSPQRMCNVTTIINKKPTKAAMEVLIIGQELGY